MKCLEVLNVFLSLIPNITLIIMVFMINSSTSKIIASITFSLIRGNPKKTNIVFSLTFCLLYFVNMFRWMLKPLSVVSQRQLLSRARLFATPWTAACQAPLSMEFSWQGSWNGLSFLSPRDLPDPGIEPGSPALQADCLPTELPGKPCKYLLNQFLEDIAKYFPAWPYLKSTWGFKEADFRVPSQAYLMQISR